MWTTKHNPWIDTYSPKVYICSVITLKEKGNHHVIFWMQIFFDLLHDITRATTEDLQVIFGPWSAPTPKNTRKLSKSTFDVTTYLLCFLVSGIFYVSTVMTVFWFLRHICKPKMEVCKYKISCMKEVHILSTIWQYGLLRGYHLSTDVQPCF